jgi:two-component system, NtrC family, sensor histidine kinase HydH
MKLDKPNLITRPKILLLIFLAIGILMVSSALYELNQSKEELLLLMAEQSHALLEALDIASKNALDANYHLNAEFRERLLNNANFIKNLYEQGAIDNALLKRLSAENNIYRINIYNRNGKKIFSNHEPEHTDLVEKFDPGETLEPIFSGQQDTLIIGIRTARFEQGHRYALAIAAKNRSAIVLNVDAQDFLNFRRRIGFGSLLRALVMENKGIVYATLQDTSMILAASGNVRQLENITSSPFLYRAFSDSLFLTRIIDFEDEEVFEAVHTFGYQNSKVGLFRIGLSLDALEQIQNRIYRRLAVISVVLTIIGSIVLMLIFTMERFSSLQKRYFEVETYSRMIIEHASDAIIVSEVSSGIKIFNDAAEHLFSMKRELVLGFTMDKILSLPDCELLMRKESFIGQMECFIQNKKCFLLISKNSFKDSEGRENTVYLFRDLTHQKQLELQMERKERMTAMGELASGVAHEIRNPLNTIGTIVQQLKKDFKPQNDEPEYLELTELVYSEVKRINETIQDFLRFSRPEKIQPQVFELENFISQLQTQYKAACQERQIKFNKELNWHGVVVWDYRQMKQVFINLIQNAIEAVEKEGEINLQIDALNDSELQIILRDNGPGINEEAKKRMFNLYYTTKAKGTGIGLSIVQRIVYEHGGIIEVDSEPGNGTMFFIKMPMRVEGAEAV